MMRHKPEILALFVALIGTLAVLVVFLTDLALARERDLKIGERRAQRFGIMMAEYTARAFDTLDVLLRDVASDLSLNKQDWPDWEPKHGWEYVAQHHSWSLPQLRDLTVLDRLGNQRFISTYFPPPQVSIRDQPYFATLEKGSDTDTVTFGPYISQNPDRYSYVIGRRIVDAEGHFAGAALAVIEPAYLAEFCWSNRLSDDFEGVLINVSGQIIGSC